MHKENPTTSKLNIQFICETVKKTLNRTREIGERYPKSSRRGLVSSVSAY